MSSIWVTIISGFLIILGTLGSVLPFLPGLPVAFGGLVLYAYLSKAVSIWALAVFAFLILLTIVVDVIAPGIAAKGHKGSRYGVIGAMLGMFLGIFVLGPPGILFGPFLGAFIGEMIHASNAEHALKVATASLFGLVISSVFKLLVGFSMFVYFIIIVIK